MVQDKKQPLDLEDIVRLANQVGLEYVEARRLSEKLEMLKATEKARITDSYDDGSISEAKLKRLTETDEKWVLFLDKLADARAKSEALKVRYDSYKNLFEAKRSLMSYRKAEMRHL
ncbi:MAG: hypothetical protein AB8C84_03795 [Oligoflexales bacterium]